MCFPNRTILKSFFFEGDRNNKDIFKDWQTVYVHFVFGITVVRERPDENRELMRLLGDEIIKFDKRVEEQNLLLDHNLRTDADVEDFKKEALEEIEYLSDARQKFRNELKCAVRANDLPKQNEIKADIKQLTGRIQKLRKQVKICDRILTQEPKVEQDLHVVKDYTEELKRKEVDRHGNVGRRSRTSR